MKKTLILLFFLLFSVLLYSQNVIEGKLLSTTGEAAANVIITLSPKNNRQVLLAHGFSGKDGSFRIQTKPGADSVLITFRSMNYRDTTILSSSNRKNILLFLIPEDKKIREVTVSSAPYKKRGDTTIYFVNSFSAEKDFSIGDVINKMPGFEEGSDGRIYYQGQQIEKYYIEGLDLLENNYQLANKNLPHSAVGSVEVLEKHQSKKIFEGIIESDNVALNIRLKNKVTVTGTANITAGLPLALWDINLTPMLFNKNRQIIASVQSNNTGKSLNSQFVKMKLGNTTVETQISSKPSNVGVTKLNYPEIKQNRYLDNSSLLSTYNDLIRLNKTTNIRINASHYLNQTKQYGQKTTKYFLPDTTVAVFESTENTFFDNNLNTGFTLTGNDKKIYFKNLTNLNKNWDNETGIIEAENKQIQKASTPYFSLSNNFDFVIPLKKHFINIYTHIDFSQAPQQLEYTPAVFSQNNSIETNNSSAVLQKYDTKNLFTDNYLSFLLSVKPLTFETKSGFKYSDREIITNLIYDENTNTADSLRNNLQWDYKEFYLTEIVRLRRKKFNLSLTLPLTFMDYDIRDKYHDSPENISDLFFTPRLGGDIELGKYFHFYGGIGYSKSISEISSLMQGYVIRNHRNMSRNSNETGYRNGISYSGRLTFRNLKHGLFSNLRWIKTHRQNNLISTQEMIATGVFIRDAIHDVNYSFSDNISAEISKYFPAAKTTFKIKSHYFSSRRETILNNEKVSQLNHLIEISPEIVYNSMKGLSLTYSYKPRLIKQKTAINENSVVEQSHALSLYYIFDAKKWVSFENEYYKHNNQEGENNLDALFSHFTFGYTLKNSDMRFLFMCNNIFNARYISNYYASDFSLIQNYYQVRTREFRIGVSFSLLDLKKL